MKRFKLIGLVASIVIGCFVLASERHKIISGVAEYSFDDLYKFIRTKNRLYQVKSEALTRDEKIQLDQIGSNVSVSLDSAAIEKTWLLDLNEFNENSKLHLPAPISSFTRLGSNAMIVGEILPSTNDIEGFIQVDKRIYRINKTHLSLNEKIKFDKSNSIITLIIPSAAILSSWATEPSLPMSRAPASLLLNEHFELVGEMLSVRGVVGYSLDEKALLVQSGGRFALIDRALIKDQGSKFDTGRRVSLLVPRSAILLLWNED